MTQVASGVVQAIGTANASVITVSAAFLGYWGFGSSAPWELKHVFVLALLAVDVFFVCKSLQHLSADTQGTPSVEFMNIQKAKIALFLAFFSVFGAFALAIFIGF